MKRRHKIKKILVDVQFQTRFESSDKESKINIMYELLDESWKHNCHTETPEINNKLNWIMINHKDIFIEAKERCRPTK